LFILFARILFKNNGKKCFRLSVCGAKPNMEKSAFLLTFLAMREGEKLQVFYPVALPGRKSEK
jgi:hypothetical protein